jgi:hypothetical protein
MTYDKHIFIFQENHSKVNSLSPEQSTLAVNDQGTFQRRSRNLSQQNVNKKACKKNLLLEIFAIIGGLKRHLLKTHALC